MPKAILELEMPVQAECDGKERYTIKLFNRTKEVEDEVE